MGVLLHCLIVGIVYGWRKAVGGFIVLLFDSCTLYSW